MWIGAQEPSYKDEFKTALLSSSKINRCYHRIPKELSE